MERRADLVRLINPVEHPVSRDVSPGAGYKEALDLLSERVWHINKEGVLLHANGRVCRDLASSLHKVTGNHISDVYPGEIASQLLSDNEAVIGTGQPKLQIIQELKLQSDNQPRVFQIDRLPYVEDGKTTGVIIVAFDITDYRKTEEALETSRLQISEAMDLARIVYWRLDPVTERFVFNDPFYAFYGTTAEFEGGYIMKGEDYGTRFVHPDDREIYNEARNKRRRYGDREFFNDVEHRIIRRDGAVRHIVARIRAIKDSGGRSIVCYGANQDITERKEAELQLEAERLHKENQLRKEKALEQSREELRHLSEHLQRVRERERTRIAREVHDELGQFLTALKIDLTCVGHGLGRGQNILLEQIKAMEAKIDGAVHKVREICTELRPSILDDFGLPAAIEWHCQDLQKKTAMAFVTKMDHACSIVDKKLALVLFRIFQEGITNVLRHSDASVVQVSLRKRGENVVLKIADDGKGIDKKSITSPGSLGIIGMRERVRFWSGELTFSGARRKGTTMIVSVPFLRSPDGAPEVAGEMPAKKRKSPRDD
jgi:PAS domain S-box-containing protein